MSRGFFGDIIDEMVQRSKDDKQLFDDLQWVDKQARQKGISFYDAVFEVLYKHDVNVKAKDWLKTRN